MIEGVEIRGGAGEFEAAVIAIVLDRMANEELAAQSGVVPSGSGLPPWVRAVPQETPFPNPGGRQSGWYVRS